MMTSSDEFEPGPETQSPEHGSTRREFMKSGTLAVGGLALSAAYTRPSITSFHVNSKLKPSGGPKKRGKNGNKPPKPPKKPPKPPKK